MFRLRWQLFKLFGIPIKIDASWLIILTLLTWTFAANLLPRAVEGYSGEVYFWMGLLTALAFFGCILLHELGHAVVAKRMGIPMRGITLFLFGGVAEMAEEPPSASKEFFMAIAGPLVTVVLAISFLVLGVVGSQNGWSEIVVFTLYYLCGINTVVLIFNLVPAFPLDGGRVLRSILWAATGSLRQATRWASLSGRGFAWFLLIMGLLLILSGDIFSGIWLGLIGMFLNQAAQASYQQMVVREALQGEPLRHFMTPDPIVVSPNLDLQTWVEDFVYRYHHKAYPVMDEGELVGMMHTINLQNIPREEWSRHTVGEVMNRDLKGCCIAPDADALEALELMQRTGLSRLLVMDEGDLVGLISLKDLLRFLDVKLELGVDQPSRRREPPSPSLPGSSREQFAHTEKV